MQYYQEHLKTMVYAEFGEQTECIMGNLKIENCTMADSDLQIIKGAGGCSTYNGFRLKTIFFVQASGTNG